MKIRILGLFTFLFFPSAFVIAQSTPFSLQSVQPNAALAGSSATTVTLKGDGFTSSVIVRISNAAVFGTDQNLTPVLVDGTTLRATIPASLLTTPAVLAIQLFIQNVYSDTLFFYVYSSSPPTVTSLVPAGGLPGTTTPVTLTGTNLTGATITFGSGGVTAVPDKNNYLSAPTKWTFQVTVPADAPPGTQAVTISTPSGSAAACGGRPCTFSVIESGSWTDVSTTSFPRPTAVIRLLDERILVIGVTSGIPGYTSRAQIFDLSTSQWTDIAAPNAPHLAGSPIILLPDGRVFLGGDIPVGQTSLPEIYDPASGQWSYIRPMSAASTGSAILLPMGKVLMQHPSLTSPSADLFDPVSGRFEAVSIPPGTMQLLADGKVLVVSPFDGNKLYDPPTGVVSAVPAPFPTTPNSVGYTTRLLPDGRVLIQGGERFSIHDALLVGSHAAIYDPRTNTMLPTSISIGGGSPIHGTVVMPSGNVFISEVLPTVTGPVLFRSTATAVLYDPNTDRIFPQTTANPPFAPDLLLDDGRAFGISDLNGTEFHGVFAGIYTPLPYSNPAPVIGSVLAPTTTDAGPISLDIRGTSFLPNSVVQLGQSRLVTLYLGAQRLVAFVPPALRSLIGSGISINNPGPGGGATDPVPVGFTRILPIDDVEKGTTRTGYAIITPDPNTSAPVATLTAGIVRDGIVQSQAAILPTPLTSDTFLLVDIVQSIGRNLGVAIANPNGTTALVTLTLRDEQGTQATSPVALPVAPGNQIARFVSELFPSGTVGPVFRGSLSIQSSLPVSIMGSRFSGQEFSTVPVPVTGNATVPRRGSVGGANAVIFPQIAMSGGWATTFGLVNTGGNAISGRIDLFDNSGNAMTVTLNGLTGSTFNYSIPAHGTFTLAPRDPSGQSPF